MTTSRYLPADAIALLDRLFRGHPGMAVLAALAVYVVIVGIFRRRAGRAGPDLLIVALILTAAVIFVSACLYLLATHPGYRFVIAVK